MTQSVTVEQLLARIGEAWNDLNAYLRTLTEAQMTQPTDAGGWTVKDHIIHLAIWEDGITALLNHQPRWEAMGVDNETARISSDAVNAVLFPRYRDMPLADVLAKSRASHQRLTDTIRALSDEDIQRPYRHYAPDTRRNAPVLNWIAGNTFRHFREHKPWIQAIAESA